MYELAHVASKQGEVAAENIKGIESIMDYRSVPVSVFTYPEIAFVVISPYSKCKGELFGRIAWLC